MNQFDMRDVTGFLDTIGVAAITKGMISDGSISRAAIAAAEIDKSMRPVSIVDMARLGVALRHPGKSIFITSNPMSITGPMYERFKKRMDEELNPVLCVWDEAADFPTDALANKRWERSLEWLKGPESRLSPDEWRKQFECDFSGEPSKEEIDKEHEKYCREMKRRERAAASRSTRSRPWERF